MASDPTQTTEDRLQSRETMLRNLMRRNRPRCECGGIIWASTCICGSCGKVTIVPDDGVQNG
jgi:hypothetical protein